MIAMSNATTTALKRAFWMLAALAVGWVMVAGGANAAEVVGAPKPWQLGMQAAATPVKQFIDQFHDMLLVLITAISIFVLVLLIYVVMRFRASANPVPSKTAHNTMIEVVWTLVPVLILVVVAVPSFKLLYFEDRQVAADMTIKAVGHQWYWTYEYPDQGGLSFDSIMIERKDLKPGQMALLDVDNRLVVPAGKTVRVLITSDDVLHAFFVPSFGVQRTAVPGKINESWFKVDKPGVYYGQCSELCGIKHSYMPIAIEAMTQADYDKWLAAAKKAAGIADNSEQSATKFAAVQQ